MNTAHILHDSHDVGSPWVRDPAVDSYSHSLVDADAVTAWSRTAFTMHKAMHLCSATKQGRSHRNAAPPSASDAVT
jgi:hypothetical protein